MRPRILAAATAAGSLAAGVVLERTILNKKRRVDAEAGEDFGSRRGERSYLLDLDDGARLFIEEVGPAKSKKAAIFVHGSALRSDMWHYQMAGLGGHRLVFYDLRGHGRSRPKGDKDPSMSTLADDLAEVIDGLATSEVVIVGHSVGGMVAMQLCKQRPDLVGDKIKGLVLLNTTPRPPTETLLGGMGVARIERVARRPIDAVSGYSRQLDAIRRSIAPTDAVFWGVSYAAFGTGASASQIDFTYKMVSETPGDVIFDLLKAYRTFDMTRDLSAVTVPVAVISGTSDRLTVTEASREMAEALPKAGLTVLEGCGHMSMLERHSQVDAIITEFLNDVLGRPKRKATAKK
jgi:pimeloyl-ACP methyl ester carboxylesterase